MSLYNLNVRCQITYCPCIILITLIVLPQLCCCLIGHNISAIGLMCLGVNKGDVIHGSQDKSDDKQLWETGTDEG
jgi:hypothetical protein